MGSSIFCQGEVRFGCKLRHIDGRIHQCYIGGNTGFCRDLFAVLKGVLIGAIAVGQLGCICNANHRHGNSFLGGRNQVNIITGVQANGTIRNTLYNFNITCGGSGIYDYHSAFVIRIGGKLDRHTTDTDRFLFAHSGSINLEGNGEELCGECVAFCVTNNSNVAMIVGIKVHNAQLAVFIQMITDLATA